MKIKEETFKNDHCKTNSAFRREPSLLFSSVVGDEEKREIFVKFDQ